VNQVLNQSPIIRRKDAERLVLIGRAEWVGSDQLRLVLSHPSNCIGAAIAARGYEWPAGKIPDARELRHIPIVCAEKALRRK
jgi:hypothetical protein